MVATIPREKRVGRERERKGSSLKNSRMWWRLLAAVCSYAAADLRGR